jgi:aldehyde dehydrogenase (NAD+)
MSLPLFKTITIEGSGVTYEQPLGLFINNEFVKSKKGQTLTTYNPSNDKPITDLYRATEEDINEAVRVARHTYNTVWKKKTGLEIAALLRKLAALVEEDKHIFSAIEAMDAGKPRHTNAAGDIAEVITVFEYYSGWADKITGKTILGNEDRLCYTRHEPYGVCGQIIPWNYPMAMAAWKIGPAIATGNVVVLKTAEQTPLSMLYFATLVVKAGFPPGVINIVSGYGREAGAALASHLDVDKIAFTGSTATGKLIMEMAAKTNLKAVTLECGGKSPLLIFDDCDLEQAVKWATVGIMYNMGQVCCATSRIYVQEGIYEKFVLAMKKWVEESTKLGDVMEESCEHGPQVTRDQQQKVLGYIEKGKQSGARLVTGGFAPKRDGYYVQPTVFADVTGDMDIVREEIFGPVVAVGKFTTEEDGIQKANDTNYGLGAAVFTENITKAHRVASEIDAGTVFINSSGDTDIRLPFGGFKMSGVGQELGEYGLHTYTRIKAVQVNLNSRL